MARLKARLGKLEADHAVLKKELAEFNGEIALRRTLVGHESVVYCVAFHPNGKILASASYDQTVKLWDVASGKNIATLKGHKSSVSSVAFSPDGKTLASGSDTELKLWDPVLFKETSTLEAKVDHSQIVAFSPDGKTLASQGIRFWDVATGEENKEKSKRLEGNRFSLSVAFSPDGKYLAGGTDPGVMLWDLASGKGTNLTPFGNQGGQGYDLAFSPDSKTLASPSSPFNPLIRLFDVAARKVIATTDEQRTLHQDALAFSPDGKLLASGSQGHTVILWTECRQAR